MSEEIAYLGLAEAAERIRAKKLSPVEYTTGLLARIERHDPQFNVFISLMPERALAAARRAEDKISAGRWRGPFHGMPYALKDIIDVEELRRRRIRASWPTTAPAPMRRSPSGSKLRAGSCSASSRPTNSRSAAHPSTCPGPR